MNYYSYSIGGNTYGRDNKFFRFCIDKKAELDIILV